MTFETAGCATRLVPMPPVWERGRCAERASAFALRHQSLACIFGFQFSYSGSFPCQVRVKFNNSVLELLPLRSQCRKFKISRLEPVLDLFKQIFPFQIFRFLFGKMLSFPQRFYSLIPIEQNSANGRSRIILARLENRLQSLIAIFECAGVGIVSVDVGRHFDKEREFGNIVAAGAGTSRHFCHLNSVAFTCIDVEDRAHLHVLSINAAAKCCKRPTPQQQSHMICLQPDLGRLA